MSIISRTAQALGRWLINMFDNRVEDVFSVKVATSYAMQQHQQLCRAYYKGLAPHNIGDASKGIHGVPSQHVASHLCSRIAKAVCVELEWDIAGKVIIDEKTYEKTNEESELAAYIKEQMEAFIDSPIRGLRQAVEKGNANGNLLLLMAKRGDKILIKLFETDAYYPVTYSETGVLTEVITRTEMARGEFIFTLLSKYYYDETKRFFGWEHKAYRRQKDKKTASDTLGDEVELSTVPEWESLNKGLDGKEYTGVTEQDRAWFCEYVSPQNNYIEAGSTVGIPMFSKALDLIRKLDIEANRLEVTEFEFKETAVFAPAGMWRDIGKKDATNIRKSQIKLDMPKGKDRLYINTNIGEDMLPVPYSPDIRITPHLEYINSIKRDIEDVCEIARNTLSDANISAKTATEIVSTEQESKTTECDIQTAWEITLREIAEIIRAMAIAYKMYANDEYEFTIHWADGVIEDEAQLFARTRQMMNDGLISPAEARSRIDGISIQEAMARLPKQDENESEYEEETETGVNADS